MGILKGAARSGGGGGFANPMTTLGDTIRGGASGTPERVAVGSSGQVLTVVAGVPAWADLWSTLQSSDPMTGAGWSAFGVSGTGSAAWASSKLTISTTGLGAGAGGYDDTTYITDADSYDIAARIDFVSGDGAAGNVYCGLFVGATVASTCVALVVYADHTIRAEYRSGGTTTLANIAGPDSAALTGGQLWLRIKRTPTAVAYSWGVGVAGALPTSWTTVWVSVLPVALNAAAGAHVLLYAEDVAGATALTVDVLAIRTAIEGAPL